MLAAAQDEEAGCEVPEVLPEARICLCQSPVSAYVTHVVEWPFLLTSPNAQCPTVLTSPTVVGDIIKLSASGINYFHFHLLYIEFP
jgi:hypothetical protein